MTFRTPDIPLYAPNSDVDPLGAVPHLEHLPLMNRLGDAPAIVQALRDIVPSDGIVDHLPGIWERGGALSVISDTDYLLSSAQRHGVDPVQEVPDLLQMLRNAAAIAHTVDGAPEGHPRAVIDAYVYPRLIEGAGHVAFQGTGAEVIFQQETRRSFDMTRSAAAVMAGIDLHDDSPEETAERLDFTAAQIRDMMHSTVRAINAYRGENGPFAVEHQPYFKPLMVDGKRVDASGAAQLPSVGVEWLARGLGADTSHEEGQRPGEAHYLNGFYVPNIPHTPVTRRVEIEMFERTNGTSIFDYLRNLEPDDPRRLTIAPAYLGLIRAFTSFGSAHGAGASRDFANRPDGAKGAGGYDDNDLRRLLLERREHLAVATALLGPAENTTPGEQKD